jgi:positive regulator of sigma E activity
MRPPHRAAPASVRVVRDTEEGTAAGIYGIIVSAAVMAATHLPSAIATVVAVLVTLVTYWAAERYARIVAERIHEGRRPGWRTLRRQLTSGWEMISTSVLPLVVLIVARLLGAALQTAIIWALACSTLLLCAAGWRVGRGGRLTAREQVVSTLVAGVFGAGLIVLKTLLH